MWPLLLALSAPAQATDTWTTPHTGIELLHRKTSEPIELWAARVDLSLPNIALHASANRSGVERKVNTKTFAANVGATLAINGDWSDGSTPVGLAISEGDKWHNHIPDDDLGSTWGYIGCTIGKQCTMGVEQPLDVAWWFSNPVIAPYRYYHAIGANGIQMLRAGEKRSGCYDSSDNPRSAACMEADGTHMWLIVVDGRSSASNGMTCNEIRDLMLELGCYDGVMLDGGGSSTMVLDGAVLNDPSDGSLRTVSNHLAVIVHDSIDAACVKPNGRWCSGSVISTCQGGQFDGSGDCAAYGATCQEDGDWAFCVDSRCPAGDGMGLACLDGTRFASCTDGQYGEGDCAAFGLTCGTDAGGAACQDPRCLAGPHSSFCASGATLGACTDGAYAESTCASGSTCASDAAGAYCADDRCAGLEGGVCSGEVLQTCERGTVVETDCAAAGLTCADGAGCLPPESLIEEGGGSAWNRPEAGNPPGRMRPFDAITPSGCATVPGAGGVGLLGLLAALARRRRA